MKMFYISAILCLSGCVSVNLPNVVSDTVQVTKDTYKSIKDGKKNSTASPVNHVFTHSYIGKDSQKISEIKEFCVSEAAQKLKESMGKEMTYTVMANEIVTINNNTIANCKLNVEG